MKLQLLLSLSIVGAVTEGMLITENNRNAQADGWMRSQNVQENARDCKISILDHIHTILVCSALNEPCQAFL